MSPAQPAFREILDAASKQLAAFEGHCLDVLEVAKPQDLDYAVHLSKVISKLSPLLGNTIEYRAILALNEKQPRADGRWVRQDPGFPDTIFAGDVTPTPGIEIKTWFPLATEITARFKDSVTHFRYDQTNVAVLAWLPERVIFGKPMVVAVWVASARSVAEARDSHYHDPPDYLVLEPEDTTSRTRNLQQTNTNAHIFQGTPQQREEASKIVGTWGPAGRKYSPSPQYQARLRTLLANYPYRSETNFAKMDRIGHQTLETFKQKVLEMRIVGQTIRRWSSVIRNPRLPGNIDLIRTLIS